MSFESDSGEESVRKKTEQSQIWLMLYRKLFPQLYRNKILYFEMFLACIVWLLLLVAQPFIYGYFGNPKPPLQGQSFHIKEFIEFFGFMQERKIIGYPNDEKTRFLMKNMKQYLSAILPIEIEMVEEGGDAFNAVYHNNQNAIAIKYINSNESLSYEKPVIQVYYQSASTADPLPVIYDALIKAISIESLNINIMHSDIRMQMYPSPNKSRPDNMDLVVGSLAPLPYFISSLCIFQMHFDELENGIQSLMLISGLTPFSYYMSLFIGSCIVGMIPYFVYMTFMKLYVFYVRTSFAVLITISFLYVISQSSLQLVLMLLIKNPYTGRSLVVLFIFLSAFFAYLHNFFTLSEQNSAKYLMHLFSLWPQSCFQIISLALYKENRCGSYDITFTSKDRMNYKLIYAIIWLSVDFVICMLIFLLALYKNEIKERILSLFKEKADVFEYLQPDNGIDNKSILSVHDLCINYGATRALDMVDFDIHDDEMILLIGPNGAGKSTLINTLCGVAKPTEGHAYYYGKEISFENLATKIGICFQDNILVNLLSVEEHIKLFLGFYNLPLDAYEDDPVYLSFGFDQIKDSLCKELSGGQKRMLSIYLSLIGKPTLILLDEPTAGVDMKSRHIIWKVISSINCTKIITSHALEEYETNCSRLFIIANGELKYKRTLPELKQQTQAKYLLHVDCDEEDLIKIYDVVKNFNCDAVISTIRKNLIEYPMTTRVSPLLFYLDEHKQHLGIRSYTFTTEPVENEILRIIDEGKNQN